MASTFIVNTPSQAIPQYGASHTQRVVGSSPVALMGHTLKSETSHVLVQFLGNDARVVFDGSTNSESVGFLYAEKSSAYLTKKMATSAVVVRSDSTGDCTVETQELSYGAL